MAALMVLAVFCGRAAAEDYSLMQYLNIQYARSGSFNPEGTEVIYVSNITGVPQIWRQSAFGGYQVQVTFDTNGVSGGWWSPSDVNLMVVSAAVGGNERTQLYLTNPYGGAWNRVSADDKAIYSFGAWSTDGSRFAYSTNSRNKTDFDVYEYTPAVAQSFLLYQGTGQNSAVEYSPDHRYLLIVCETSAANTDLLLFDRESHKTRQLTKHDGDELYANPQWDSDGKGFYLLCDKGRDFTGLAYWPLDSAGFRWVETPDADIEQFDVSRNGAYLAWTVNDNGYSRFHFRNLTKEKSVDVGPNRTPEGVISGMRFSNDSRMMIFTFGSGNRNSDLWVYESLENRLHQLTFSASGGIPQSAFRAPELVQFESFDGKKIPALWYTPEGAKGKMPVIVSIHGGPEGQARPMLSGLFQYYLSRGYAILEPNVRGSTGYGKSYLAADNISHRMEAVQDVEYAARWLKARKDVDGKKLVIFGGSYGGFMVLSSLTTYPDTWSAGVSIVGIANFVTFLQNTGAYRRALREVEYGSLARDSSFLVDISPITHVDKIKAPLFLIQGANDPRVPKGEADQMAAAIKARGGVVQYLLFEDEGHGLTKTRNRIIAYSQVADFLDKYVTKK
jgi:dipeptidyl aminopeptidase/acylaminoacyl peptidase